MVLGSSQCLTRVIVDGAQVDVAQLGDIHARIDAALRRIPAHDRAHLANALLDLAVARIVTRLALVASEQH